MLFSRSGGFLRSMSASLPHSVRVTSRRSVMPTASAEGGSQSEGPATCGGAADQDQDEAAECASPGSFDIVLPKTRRPRLANPRRYKFASAPGAVAGAPWEGLLGRRELETAARHSCWHVMWPQGPDQEVTPELPPAGVEAVVVVQSRGEEAAAYALVRALRKSGGLDVPVFVVLAEVSGSSQDDYEYALAMHRELVQAGAEDVLCNTRTAQEFQLSLALGIQRRAARLDAIGRERACAAEALASMAVRQRGELEEAAAMGLFWQSVDRLFKDFPIMDRSLAADVAPGVQVGPCLLQECIGRGSFGRVYSAVNERSGAAEAVKVVAKLSVTQCKHASALWKEMHTLSCLRHDHVIRFFGAMHGPLHIFIRMEQASGDNLLDAARAAGGTLPLEDVRRYQAQLAGAVAYCHSEGVAHRDLKPENIALDNSGRDIKVLDFGCSVRVGFARTDIAGSFPFMAPEVLVASPSRRYEPSGADVWSSAVVLLELLCGVHHFRGLLGWDRATRVSHRRAAELVQYFSDETAIRRSLIGQEVTADLEEMLRGMLEVEAARRWSAGRVARSGWLQRERFRRRERRGSIPRPVTL